MRSGARELFTRASLKGNSRQTALVRTLDRKKPNSIVAMIFTILIADIAISHRIALDRRATANHRFWGSPTMTNGAQNFGSAHSGSDELAIIRSIDCRNASACERRGFALSASNSPSMSATVASLSTSQCETTSDFAAAWGISFLWRYTPPEIAVRIANPEVHIAQDSPLKVTQDKPFDVTQSEPFKIDSPKVIVRADELPRSVDNGIRTDPKTGEVIKREVTVFTSVRHGPGTVTTGWIYRDGSGGVPHLQYCYYAAPNLDNTSRKVDIASNRVPLPINTGLVPDLGEALAKCQWWQE
jgi:hypothetical protein